MNLTNEELREIGVSKLKHRKLILQETQTKKKGSSRPALTVKQIRKEPEAEPKRPEKMMRKLKHRKLITQEAQKMRNGSSKPAGLLSVIIILIIIVTVKQIEKEPKVANSRENYKRMVVISSTGGTAQREGGVLGQFEYIYL